MSRLLLFLASIAPAIAQISSGCNPRNTTTTCTPNPALGIDNTWNFINDTLENTDIWNITNGQVQYGSGGAEFRIAKKGDAPTVLSNFYFMWGQASIYIKAAPGQGIVSSVTYLSDDLDEIDWEWIGGNNTHVQTNYFGKGNTTVYDRAVWVPVNDPINTWHNYSINWNKNGLQWLIDGAVVRNLPVAAADDNGNQYPQTPMNVHMGIWAGGDDTLPGNSNWTAQWAGGMPDYTKAPFTMQVQTLTVDDGTKNASTYTYGDKSGSWQSIKVAMGNSTAAQSINKPPEQSLSDKFNGLSTTAKIGIACGIGAAVLILAVLCTICCLRKRKAGRAERVAADADWDKANSEMMAYRAQMATPLATPQYRNQDPFSDSKTDLATGGGQAGQWQPSHYAGNYPMSPQSPVPGYGQGYGPPRSPNPQYAPVHHKY